MKNKKKKTLILNTLALILCAIIVGLFCINPKQEQVLNKYQVIFDTDGGNVMNALEIEDGELISIPDAPTREGYEFVGWMIGDEMYDFNEEITGDVTLKAKWKKIEPDVTYYTIDFDSAGGSTVNRLILEANAIPTEPTSPTREGYEFVGWYFNGVLFDFNLPLTQNITLTAEWVQIEEPEQPENPVDPEKPEENKTYTVKFNLNGASGSIPSQTVKSGEKAKQPSNPARSGYTFSGWRLNSANGKAYNFNSKVTSNITLYASWTKISTPVQKITVRFFAENGNVVLYTRNVNSGTTITNPPAGPNKPFYRFDGWFSSRAGGTNITRTKITSTMTDFYPKYTKQNITVTCPVGSNEFTGDGIMCTVTITASIGTLPSGVVIKKGDNSYSNGAKVTPGQYNRFIKDQELVNVCESSSSSNCTDATFVKADTQD